MMVADYKELALSKDSLKATKHPFPLFAIPLFFISTCLQTLKTRSLLLCSFIHAKTNTKNRNKKALLNETLSRSISLSIRFDMKHVVMADRNQLTILQRVF